MASKLKVRKLEERIAPSLLGDALGGEENSDSSSNEANQDGDVGNNNDVDAGGNSVDVGGVDVNDTLSGFANGNMVDGISDVGNNADVSDNANLDDVGHVSDVASDIDTSDISDADVSDIGDADLSDIGNNDADADDLADVTNEGDVEEVATSRES